MRPQAPHHYRLMSGREKRTLRGESSALNPRPFCAGSPSSSDGASLPGCGVAGDDGEKMRGVLYPLGERWSAKRTEIMDLGKTFLTAGI